MLKRLNREQLGINISDFKQYANINTDNRDDELEAILHAAISKVEDIANTSITSSVYELSTEIASTKVKLYNHPVTTIISVIDNNTGNEISYNAAANKAYITLSTPYAVVVKYATSPVAPPLYDQLRIIALEVAAAYYDGVTDNKILSDIYNKIPKQW